MRNSPPQFLGFLILALLFVTLQSKKCKRGSSNPPVPPGSWETHYVGIGVYGRYPTSTGCNYNGPAAFSNPSNSPGTCNTTYGSYTELQKHYTKVYVRYAGQSNFLKEYCWSGGSSTIPIEIPVNRDPSLALVIEFSSKEICAGCTPNSSERTRALWKDSKSYAYNQGIPYTVLFSPQWHSYSYDQYCN